MINVVPGYSYNDLLLVPKFSNIYSRSEVDISTDLGKGIKLTVPVVSANMKTVTGQSMSRAIADIGGLAIIHRFDTPENRIKEFVSAVNVPNFFDKNSEYYSKHIGVSVGVTKEEYRVVDSFIKTPQLKIICIDVAHGHHDLTLKMIEYISVNAPELLLIAGNVATGNAAYDLASAGADVIKCGIGNGSSCLTRINAGNGVPSVTALEDVYSMVKGVGDTDLRGYKFKIIADGGIQTGGHVTIALCFSHAVMLGNLLAGTDESPSDKVEFNGKMYKRYAGSSTHKLKNVEGVSGLVPYRGPVENVIEELMQGLRSGCSYQGAKNLEELRRDPQFVSITSAGYNESKPHSILL